MIIHWPAVIEPEPSGAVRVTPLLLDECTASAPTREEAQERAAALVSKRLSKRHDGDGRAMSKRAAAVKLAGSMKGKVLVDLSVTFYGAERG